MHSRTCSTCPWTGTNYRSAAIADSAKAKHSCERHRRAAAVSAAHKAKIDSTRVVRDCQHKRAQHVHGTWLAYACDLCRCRPCTDAETAYQARRMRLTAYGQWKPLTPTGPVRKHVKMLMSHGMSIDAITETAGVGPRVTARLLYTITQGGKSLPPSKTMRSENAEALLAVTVNFDHHRRVKAVGATRRLRALVTMGYPASFLAEQLGNQPGNVHRYLRGPDSIYRTTNDKIITLYQRLWTIPPVPGTQFSAVAIAGARKHASKNGWVSPFGWNDGDLDNPVAVPNLAAFDSSGNRTRDKTLLAA